MSAAIKSKITKQKFRHFLKVAADVIDANYCP